MQDDAISYNNLASRLLEEGDARRAAFAAREAIRRDSSMWQPVHTMAVALEKMENFPSAAACFRQTLTLHPNHPLAQNQLICALIRAGKSEEAVGECKSHLRAGPGDPNGWCNLGLALRQQCRYHEAIEAYRTGLRLAPDDARLHWNLSIALLATGQFEEGWREYEWRVAAGIAPPTLRDEPMWRGEPLAGKSILLESEQGLGDTIQFLRYAPWFEQQGARVFIDCQLRLRNLFRRWIPTEAQDYDFRAPMMSLPLITQGLIPTGNPYLQAPPLDFGEGFHAGLCWAGNAANSNDRFRSMDPNFLQPLLNMAGINWISLEQKTGDTIEQLASTLMGLDLIITVDTMVAHLAGALGRPVWTMLCYSPDWRWMEQGDYTHWYPSMHLFRQPSPGDWTSVVREVSQQLQPAQSKDLRFCADLAANACVK